MDMKLEVAVLPVTDVDRARDFHTEPGWRLDADFTSGPGFRVVQLTPPGSACSVIFGTGVTAAVPGSVEQLILVVDDIQKARAEIAAHGVQVSEVFHDEGGVFHHAGTGGRVPGPEPAGQSYASFAAFTDPDGNGWLLMGLWRAGGGDEMEAILESLPLGEYLTTQVTPLTPHPSDPGAPGSRSPWARERTGADNG